MHPLLVVEVIFPAPAGQGGLIGGDRAGRIAPPGVLGQPLVLPGRLPASAGDCHTPSMRTWPSCQWAGIRWATLPDRLVQERLALVVVPGQFAFQRRPHQAGRRRFAQ